MCLMNAYLNDKGNKTLLMSNVQRVENGVGYVVLHDLMERTQRVAGTLTRMDMVENILEIEGKEHE